MTEEFTFVGKRYDNHLCRDAAHLHDEVLPEVVLGKFHVAVRASSRTRKKQVRQVGGKRTDRQRGTPPWKGGDERVSICLIYRFVLPGQSSPVSLT
jgi:hypothetical protein